MPRALVSRPRHCRAARSLCSSRVLCLGLGRSPLRAPHAFAWRAFALFWLLMVSEEFLALPPCFAQISQVRQLLVSHINRRCHLQRHPLLHCRCHPPPRHCHLLCCLRCLRHHRRRRRLRRHPLLRCRCHCLPAAAISFAARQSASRAARPSCRRCSASALAAALALAHALARTRCSAPRPTPACSAPRPTTRPSAHSGTSGGSGHGASARSSSGSGAPCVREPCAEVVAAACGPCAALPTCILHRIELHTASAVSRFDPSARRVDSFTSHSRPNL